VALDRMPAIPRQVMPPQREGDIVCAPLTVGGLHRIERDAAQRSHPALDPTWSVPRRICANPRLSLTIQNFFGGAGDSGDGHSSQRRLLSHVQKATPGTHSVVGGVFRRERIPSDAGT